MTRRPLNAADPWRNQSGAALVIAVIAAGLAALVTATALALAEAEVREARAWPPRARLEAAALSAVDRALAAWPSAFATPGPEPVTVELPPLAGIRSTLTLTRLADSVALLQGRAQPLDTAVARGMVQAIVLLIRLVPDSATGSEIVAARPLGAGRDWITMAF